MKRLMVITVMALAAALLLPALAGEGYKCSASAEDCLAYMAEKMANRGWAGVELEHNDSEQLAVTEVHAGTPAAKAGVKVGDVLLAINGVELREENKEQLAKFESAMKPGATFDYTIARYGKERKLTLTLAKMPEDVLYAMVGKHLVEQHAEIASN